LPAPLDGHVWPPVPLPLSSRLARIGARDRDAQQPFCYASVRQWPCAPLQQGLGQFVEGSLAAGAPVAFAPGSVVVLARRIARVTVAPVTMEGAIFPPEGVDIRLTLLGAEELVDIGEKRHNEKPPGS